GEIVRLKMAAPDGKQRLTDAADRQTLLRLIQSIATGHLAMQDHIFVSSSCSFSCLHLLSHLCQDILEKQFLWLAASRLLLSGTKRDTMKRSNQTA
ncbi:MAG: hypothetical protein E6J34_23400, partial [Chloroflexi bacterium]